MTRYHSILLAVVAAVAPAGCSTVGPALGITPPTHPLLDTAKALRDSAPIPAPVPTEANKELHPAYVVEPGDTLLVQPVELDSPVRLPPDQPVQADGTIDLGKYGRPVVAGKTLAEVEEVVKERVKGKEKEPPALTVRLIGRASKVYYVLGEVNAPGAFPLTGRETVLDGVIAAGGLTRQASEGNVVLSRPTADGCRVVLPVCFSQITQLADPTTNYQLRAGDRIYVPSRGTLEDLLPRRFVKPAPACARPQGGCAGGGCATAL